MLVQHALGVAGGAAGIAEHAGRALVALDPGIVAAFGRDQRGETVGAVAVHDDIMLDADPALAQPVDDRLEGAIVQQHAVLGMIGDIDQLLVEQARVDRVDDAAHADDTVPRRQMIAVVHRQRRHPAAGADAEPFQCLREPPRIMGDAGPGRAGLTAIGPAGHDLAAAMLARGMVDQARHPQRIVLHPAQHRPSPLVLSRYVYPCDGEEQAPSPRPSATPASCRGPLCGQASGLTIERLSLRTGGPRHKAGVTGA